MAEFPALPIWTDAYIADTGDLSAGEHGAYLVMMMIAWRRPDCALPNDMAWLKRSLGGFCSDMHGNRFNALVPGILAKFWELGSDGKFRQKRLTKERDFLSKRSEKQAERAKKRWTQSSDNNVVTDATAHGAAYAPTPTPTPTEERIATAIPKKEARSRGTRLEQSWKPSEEAIQFAWGLGLDAEREAGEFRDYWIGVPGQRGVKLDWEATWRNHCRRSAKLSAGRGGKPSGPTGFNALLFDEIGGRGFGPLDEARQPDGGGDTIIEGVAFTRRGAA
jgi:uncharacterized protein YdaU (DUF1376 family)